MLRGNRSKMKPSYDPGPATHRDGFMVCRSEKGHPVTDSDRDSDSGRDGTGDGDRDGHL